VEPLVSGGLIL